MKKATTIKSKAKPRVRTVKLLVEREKGNGKSGTYYYYEEVYIPEKLADKLYHEGLIWWNITDEIFGCDHENFDPKWIHKAKP